jgi:FKBP-type peptidyl-prolyl cis-trans isomerase FkpA
MKNITALFIAMVSLTFLFIQCNSGGGALMTESGYEYSVLHDAQGKKAQKGDYVYFEMDIRDPEGNVINSMRDLPTMPSVQIPVDRDPKAQNALLDMLGACSSGDTLSLIVPIDSMPGASVQYPNAAYFEYLVNVEEVVDKNTYTERLANEQEEARMATEGITNQVASTLADYKAGKISNLVKLPSGLEYVIHEEGTGEKVPVGERINANYYGVTKEEGNRFDDSFSRGRPFSFTLGRGEVIKGWDEGMGALPIGTKATLFIPYDMAYGENGRPPTIPARADLVFYVEILE